MSPHNVSTQHDVVCYCMVVCAVSDLVKLRYKLCPCLLDEGSEDIQVLPNGLALITSVSFWAFCVISEMILLLTSTSTTTIIAFSVNTIVDIVDNDDEDQSINQYFFFPTNNSTISIIAKYITICNM